MRYSPDGSRVVVQVEAEAEGQHARLLVDDEGPGIPPDEWPQVFERFWRGEHARKVEHSGTGIGLAVVADLCAMSNGSIEVCDAPTGGARFVVTLPATETAGEAGIDPVVPVGQRGDA